MKVPKTVLAFFLISLVMRIGYGVAIHRMEGTVGFVDDWDYISYAKNILDQGVLVPDISKLNPTADQVGPGFPLIVAMTFALFGENYLPTVILNALVSALICILILYLGKELFNEKVGIFAAGWSCIYVQYIYLIPHVLKDVWLAFLFPLVIYAFLLETKRERISVKSLSLIFLFAFLIHMDERFFAYFPLLLVSFLPLDSMGWRNGLRKAVLFFAAVTVLMIPWLIRNYYVYGKPVVLTVRTAKFTDKIFRIPTQNLPEFVWNKALVDSILLGREIPGLEYAGQGVTYGNLQLGVKQGRIPRKFGLLERWYVESKELWRPFRFSAGYVDGGFVFEGPWSLKHNASVGITYGLLLPFFVAGVILIIGRKNRKGIFIVSVLFLYTFIHVAVEAATSRYRVYADAFMIIIAFYGLLELRPTVMRIIKRTATFL